MKAIARNSAALLLAAILFGADRLLKRWFFLMNGQEFFVWRDFFKLKVFLNPGVAFGLGAGLNNFVFIFLGFMVFLGVVWCGWRFYRRGKYLYSFCLALIAGGAFSNLLDRWYFGGVIDYLEVKYFTVFNLADVMIGVGVVILFFNISNKLKNQNVKRKTKI